MAVPGLAEGDGAGVAAEVTVVVEAAGVEAASCAVMILVIKRIAPNAIGNFFIKIGCRSNFRGCDWLGIRDLANAGEIGVLHKCEPRFGRSGLTITPRENAAEFVLDQRRRRVLENAGDKKKRLNPLRSQSRN